MNADQNICLLLRCYLLLALVPKAAPGATIAQSDHCGHGMSQVEDDPLLFEMAAAPLLMANCSPLPPLLLSFQRAICVLLQVTADLNDIQFIEL